jgi:RND family efflux transporter MFP subunit
MMMVSAKYYNLIFLLVLISFQSCKQEEKPILPKKSTVTESVYASGHIKAKNQYSVYSAVNGTVAEVYVSEGDSVDIGTPLFKIHNAATDINKQQALLNRELNDIKAAENRLRDLELSGEAAELKMLNDSLLYERQQSLWSKEIGSKVELEQKKLAFENSKKTYQASKLKLLELKRQLDIFYRQSQTNVTLSEIQASEYIVKSQVKGRIYGLYIQNGEFASVQQPLAVIGATDDFLLELKIDENDIAVLKPGQKVFVSMDSYKGRTFEAVLSRILPLMNEKTKSFSAEAVFVNFPEILFPNLTFEANILIRTKENVLTVPRNYLSEDSKLYLKDGNTLNVSTGLKDYQKIEITSGLKGDEQLILPKK